MSDNNCNCIFKCCPDETVVEDMLCNMAENLSVLINESPLGFVRESYVTRMRQDYMVVTGKHSATTTEQLVLCQMLMSFLEAPELILDNLRGLYHNG
jgi:hypothetical protein